MQAWAAGNYAHMYSMLDPASSQSITEAKFAAAYRHDEMTATWSSCRRARRARDADEFIPVQMVVFTRLFGTLNETLEVPLTGSGSGATVHYISSLLFPGLQGTERLGRHMSLPPRATLFAADGTPLAEGPDRTSPISDVASEIVGTLGPIPPADAATYMAQGYPANAQIGLDGLERVFQTQLAGHPGGRAARRQAGAGAAPRPRPGTTSRPRSCRRSRPPRSPRSATATPGIVAMDPRTGGLLALAGIAFSAAQPPGSTMKIVTSTAALAAGIVKLSTVFPYSTQAILDGYTLHNASGEDCGGTLLNSFAVSCNRCSRRSARGRREAAARDGRRFGFNQTRRSPAPPRARSRRTAWAAISRSAPRRSARARSWRPRSR